MLSSGRYDVEITKFNEKGESILKSTTQWRETNTYDSIFSRSNTLYPVYEFFKSNMNQNSIVLDYGCGTGWTSGLLSQKVKYVKAMDISDGLIKVLEKYCQENAITNIEPTVGNGEILPYKDNEFDIVFGNAVLHHIELEKCLREISRVLKPGGKAAFCEPFAENPLLNLIRFVKHHYVEKYVGTDKPFKYYDLSTFQRYFTRARFIESSFLRNRFPIFAPVDRILASIPIIKRYVSYIAILLEK